MMPCANTVLSPETTAHPFETRSFLWGSRNYLLRRPVRCPAAYQDGYWVFECPDYGLSSYAAQQSEAMLQFQEEFAALYDGLIQEPDDALTADARHLRDQLREDVHILA